MSASTSQMTRIYPNTGKEFPIDFVIGSPSIGHLPLEAGPFVVVITLLITTKYSNYNNNSHLKDKKCHFLNKGWSGYQND